MTHEMQVRIYFQDTDAGGIVYHANYLNYAERARSEFLRTVGMPITGLIEQGVAFVIRHLDMDFRAPAKLDDVLTVRTHVTEVKNASILMQQQIDRGDMLLVTVNLVLAFVNPVTMRPIRVPADLKAIFLNYMTKGEN